ncbi:MAG: prolyl oligopeptidase family serine peptidase [Candidatus Obscuribacterales bacterium]|nr:prolyl oligopeptidase family serine peptidase [Candidatus Obscuribacterales bacterium]
MPQRQEFDKSIDELEQAANSALLSERLRGFEQKTPDILGLSLEINERGLFPKLAKSYAEENFSALDRNGDKYLSKLELEDCLNSELLSRKMSGLEKQLVRYMIANYDSYCKASNDQWLGEKKISLKDLSAFEAQDKSARKTAEMAKSLQFSMESSGLFQKLDADKSGKISEKELKVAAAKTGYSDEEKKLIAFMLEKRKDIAAASKDEWGWQSSITKADLKSFAEQNKLPDLATALINAAKTGKSDDAAPVLDANKALPDLILEFGKKYFKVLDADGNGYITKTELQALLDSRKWSSGLSQKEKEIIAEMIKSGEKIQRSFRDEYWYKDRSGISLKDLEAYAKFEAENRKDIPTTPGDHQCSLTIGGVKREFNVHIPPSYDGQKAMPVLYFYHYLFGTPEKMAEYSSMNKIADRDGFIVVYPKAEGVVGGRLRNWNWNNKDSDRIDDIAFSRRLMDLTQEKLKIDQNRVYLAGYSNGGMMAHEIASKMPERITALAVVNGFTTGHEAPVSKAIPAMLIHGTGDRIVPYDGRSWWKVIGLPELKPHAHASSLWKEANGVSGSRLDAIAPGVTRETFVSPKTGKEMVQITMNGYGHGWPGRSDSLDANPCTKFCASEMIWGFLSKQKGH